MVSARTERPCVCILSPHACDLALACVCHTILFKARALRASLHARTHIDSKVHGIKNRSSSAVSARGSLIGLRGG